MPVVEVKPGRRVADGSVSADGGAASQVPSDGVPRSTVAPWEAARTALSALRKATSRVPGWASRLIWVLGLVAILDGAQGGHRRLLDWPIDLLPPLGRATVSVVGIAVGFGLLLMARGLRRRKRRAWRLTVVLLVTGIVVHIARGTDPVQTLMSSAVVLVLVASWLGFSSWRSGEVK